MSSPTLEILPEAALVLRLVAGVRNKECFDLCAEKLEGIIDDSNESLLPIAAASMLFSMLFGSKAYVLNGFSFGE